MLKRYLLYLFLFVCSLSYSQIGGKSVYQFLNLVTSPRQAALGGKTVTIFDKDVNQGIFNPASINPDMHNQLSVNYGNYFGEVTYGTASYAYTYDRHLQTIHVGVNYVNYGNFDGYDENGQETAAFTGSEIAVSGGYSYNVPNTTLYIGTNVKLISSNLETYSSLGGAVDLGAIYVDEVNDINWGLAIRNIGTQFTTYSGIREQLPLEIIVGVSQQLEHVPIRWHVNLENLQQWDVSFSNPNRVESSLDGSNSEEKVSFLGNTLRHVILGAELFPEKGFNLRASYNFRRAQELKIVEQRTFSGFSIGMGLKMNKLKFDYSYSRYTLAGNTSLFGLTINFQ